jgi:uncharacterized protein
VPTSNQAKLRSQISQFAKQATLLIEGASFMAKNPPKVWILASPHSGDNTQLLALAENLGWPFEIKTLTYQPWQSLTRLMRNATLFGLTPEARSQISPPFPDLIIGAGHSTEPAAFWIKSKAPHIVKIVYLGTPLAKLESFDLVITTPQYGLPQEPNILHIDLPLHNVATEKLDIAAHNWSHTFSHLPKPWTALLIGGKSGPYTFKPDTAMRLARATQKFKGSLLVTTSARTPADVTDVLRGALPNPNYFHDWRDKSVENPFFGFLALADDFIVTGDSISMLSEACATGKPVVMFDTESGRFAMNDQGGKISLWGRGFYATVFRFAMRFGPRRWTRDLRIVHRQLISSGLARWIGEPLSSSKPTSKTTSLQQATSRVLALFER